MSTPAPSSVTVYYEDTETEPDEWHRALVQPMGAFLVVTDLTTEPRRTDIIPEHLIRTVTVVEIPAPKARVGLADVVTERPA